MTPQRLAAATLAAALVIGVSPVLARQASGNLGGSANNEAREPYSDYSVQLRDAATGQIVGTTSLNAQGQFSFENVGLTQRLLVELLNVKEKTVACTEGPYVLTTANPNRLDVNIDCGKVPAAFWLLAAGAGAAAAIAITTRSASE